MSFAVRNVLRKSNLRLSNFVACSATRLSLETSPRRTLATGTRGSRGHGWYVNYRAGKGGRHLQGEYHDRDLDECRQWNDSILELGQEQVYLDVVVEPRSSSVVWNRGDVPPLDSLTGPRHRLVMNIATTVMPETTENFINLCDASEDGYKGSLLYRFERNVGLCGGDVLTNTGKAGKAAHGTPLALDIPTDPLAMWHLEGTVTMSVAKVGQVDSRFVLCTETAQHLDGINRAFGRLTDESLEIVRGWQGSLLTSKGVPTSCDLVIVECGRVGQGAAFTEEAA